MHKEDGKRADDVYENIDVITGRSGKKITDHNASRIQSSELTGSDSVNIRSFRPATVCLVLLCVLLLTAVIVLCVHIHTTSTNYTEERDQLLTNNTNLIQLNVQINQEKNELSKFIQDGWIYYQFSLYYVSNETKNWTESRRYCTDRGADLVIIKNSEKQDLVNKISGGSGVWIGLTDSDEEGSWKWVDGSTLTSGFWGSGEPSGHINENCTISRSTGWADYPCTSIFKWICERRNLK